jgi:hypothetical protein
LNCKKILHQSTGAKRGQQQEILISNDVQAQSFILPFLALFMRSCNRLAIQILLILTYKIGAIALSGLKVLFRN